MRDFPESLGAGFFLPQPVAAFHSILDPGRGSELAGRAARRAVEAQTCAASAATAEFLRQ